MQSPKGSFPRGTEQGYSGGNREAWSGEQQRAHVQKRVNIACPRWPFFRKACLQGWTLAGIWNVTDKQIPMLIGNFPGWQEWLTVPKLSVQIKWLRLSFWESGILVRGRQRVPS